MKKTRIFLTAEQWRFVVASLNDYRNKMIDDGKLTDFADDVLLKTMSAPTKKIKN